MPGEKVKTTELWRYLRAGGERLERMRRALLAGDNQKALAIARKICGLQPDEEVPKPGAKKRGKG